MICPTCGYNNPDGSVVCSVCNSALASTPASSYSAPSYSSSGYNASGYNASSYNASGYSAAPAKKRGTGAIIAVVAVIVVLAVVACVGFFGLGWRYNGTYELDSVTIYGTTLTLEQLEEVSGASAYAELKVSFGKYELVSDGLGDTKTGNGKIKFKGDKFTIDDHFDGYVEDGNLVFEQDGSALIFKKK